jgi:uncharacterized BrkB/YihY/UPF0761 family membrane protein
MLRELLTIVIPLLLPTVVYLFWIWAIGRDRRSRHWAAMPWLWLAGAGTMLLAVVLFVITVHFGTSQPGVYVPPRYEGGRLMPSHIEPKPSQ